MQRIIGFFIVFGCVVLGYLEAKGNLGALWQPAELIIIVGAAMGAMVVAHPVAVLKGIGGQLKTLLGKGYTQDYYRAIIELMFELLETVRKDGIKKLDEHIENPDSSALFAKYPSITASPVLLAFITDNLRLMAMGKMSPHDLEALLETEIHTIQNDLLRPSKALAKTGEAMPGFGIVAAVLGIVVTMQNIGGNLALIGAKVAAALVGTFIGVLLSYGVFDPLSAAMGKLVKKEVMGLKMVMAILVAQQQGRPTLLALDAGRKLLISEYKPSFFEMERWLTAEQN